MKDKVKDKDGTLNLLQCNPATLRTTRTTCLPTDAMERLRNEWNRRFPSEGIPRSIRKKETLWAALRDRMRSRFACSTEFCAVKELGGAGAAGGYFRPPKPEAWVKKPTEWQDNLTIASVLDQYEAAYPDFEFIGPVSIDFDSELSWGRCVSDELCKLDLAALRAAGTRTLGIVFNLDPHDKPGSHWVCMFVDLPKGATYYFDSYGIEPCAEIRRLMRRCREQGCPTLVWNDIRHQRKETECGTYCLYVIISLLMGRSFRDVCMNRVDDDTMNAFRDIVFATERPRPLATAALQRLLGRG